MKPLALRLMPYAFLLALACGSGEPGDMFLLRAPVFKPVYYYSRTITIENNCSDNIMILYRIFKNRSEIVYPDNYMPFGLLPAGELETVEFVTSDDNDEYCYAAVSSFNVEYGLDMYYPTSTKCADCCAGGHTADLYVTFDNCGDPG